MSRAALPVPRSSWRVHPSGAVEELAVGTQLRAQPPRPPPTLRRCAVCDHPFEVLNFRSRMCRRPACQKARSAIYQARARHGSRLDSGADP